MSYYYSLINPILLLIINKVYILISKTRNPCHLYNTTVDMRQASHVFLVLGFLFSTHLPSVVLETLKTNAYMALYISPLRIAKNILCNEKEDNIL